MSSKLMRKLYLLSSGGVTFGLLQAWGMIDFNNILFEFLLTFATLIITALLGDASQAA